MKPLIVLDRDGVINQESSDFVKSADEWIPIPGSIEAIAALKKAGYLVAIATNQSGIGRGYYDEIALANMHEKLALLLAEFDVCVDLIVYCPHLPDEGCSCRKPLPGLLHEIERELSVKVEGSCIVGDSLRDLQAGVALGMKPVLVMTGNGYKTRADSDLPVNTAIYENLAAVAAALIT